MIHDETEADKAARHVASVALAAARTNVTHAHTITRVVRHAILWRRLENYNGAVFTGYALIDAYDAEIGNDKQPVHNIPGVPLAVVDYWAVVHGEAVAS